MDNIGKTNIVYKRIFKISVTFFLVLIQCYIMLIELGIDIYKLLHIENVSVQIIFSFILQLFVFSLAYGIIYMITFLSYKKYWITKNKNIYVKGLWLQIHIKDSIRIGTVKIKQNFYTIEATGRNLIPKTNNSEISQKITNWYYYMGKVANDGTARDFIGCYTATKQDVDVNNDGIHILKIITNKNGEPVRLDGKFSDTFSITDEDVNLLNVKEHKGQLILFKMSEQCQNYLIDNTGFRYDLLEKIHKERDFQNEPFVYELNKQLDRKKVKI